MIEIFLLFVTEKEKVLADLFGNFYNMATPTVTLEDLRDI